jgi:hypothetical protein
MALDHIDPSHEDIHKRLVNWARWVRPNKHRGQVHPMFRGALTSRQWDTDPQVPISCDTLDAMRMEKTVVRLPRPHMLVLKWWYVFPVDARRMCRTLAVSMDGLCLLLKDARTMARNNG